MIIFHCHAPQEFHHFISYYFLYLAFMPLVCSLKITSATLFPMSEAILLYRLYGDNLICFLTVNIHFFCLIFLRKLLSKFQLSDNCSLSIPRFSLYCHLLKFYERTGHTSFSQFIRYSFRLSLFKNILLHFFFISVSIHMAVRCKAN